MPIYFSSAGGVNASAGVLLYEYLLGQKIHNIDEEKLGEIQNTYSVFTASVSVYADIFHRMSLNFDFQEHVRIDNLLIGHHTTH